MPVPSINIRKIASSDNIGLAEIIREVMKEFDADPRGTIIGDPALNTMYNNYRDSNSVYYVVDIDGELAGGCGIHQLEGTDENICELQRMFLIKRARGLGIGKLLMKLCILSARSFGYKQMYLETLSGMHDAISLYESAGFEKIPVPLGNTGHVSCNVNMLLNLS